MPEEKSTQYLQATIIIVFCLLYNILFTSTGRQPNSCFKKRVDCHSLMVLNRAIYVSAADWLSQTQMKNYHNFSGVVIWFSEGWKLL